MPFGRRLSLWLPWHPRSGDEVKPVRSSLDPEQRQVLDPRNPFFLASCDLDACSHQRAAIVPATKSAVAPIVLVRLLVLRRSRDLIVFK